jgi:hypothetical protein
MGKGGVSALLLALGLAGCADTATSPETALAPSVRREGANLAAAPVALISLQGAPEGPGGDFAKALMRELSARGVTTAAPKGARYLMRGYLAARPGEGGADISYVFDVYDRTRARATRLDASFAVKGDGDAWSLMDEKTVDSLAGQSADDIAAWLSQTPEASSALSSVQ